MELLFDLLAYNWFAYPSCRVFFALYVKTVQCGHVGTALSHITLIAKRSVAHCIILCWAGICGFLWIPWRFSGEVLIFASLACRGWFSVSELFLSLLHSFRQPAIFSVLIPNWDLLSQACNSCFALCQLLGCQWIHHNHGKIINSLYWPGQSSFTLLCPTTAVSVCLFCPVSSFWISPAQITWMETNQSALKNITLAEDQTFRGGCFVRAFQCLSDTKDVPFVNNQGKRCACCHFAFIQEL